jgi:hypothetical protein
MPKALNGQQITKSAECAAKRQKRRMRSKTVKAQNAQQNDKSAECAENDKSAECPENDYGEGPDSP